MEKRGWIIFSAYDFSLGSTSEGHIAFNILQELSLDYSVIVVTRRNNLEHLALDDRNLALDGLYFVGFDLPKFFLWIKKVSRIYSIYSYLWHLCWPLVFLNRKDILKNIKLIHLFNFHNDSLPSLAWLLNKPLIWGPINHHEWVPKWRRKYWPRRISVLHDLKFGLRKFQWRWDPFINLLLRKADLIFIAGPWVENRLKIHNKERIIYRSQLGVSVLKEVTERWHDKNNNKDIVRLVVSGRLAWIKGVDLVIEAMKYLPIHYELDIVGSGSAYDKLKGLCYAEGVSSRIKFIPQICRDDLLKSYSNYDCFIFSSSEVAGLVWIEALMEGLPVVGFGGEKEIEIASGYIEGIYLVEELDDRENNIRILAELIQKVCTSNSNVDTERIKDYYSWNSFAKTIKDAYAQLH